MIHQINVREATPDDIPLIAELILDLAEYEKLADLISYNHEDIRRALFSDSPDAEVRIGEVDGKPEGFALFFHNYSTFLGRRGLYLEDLFVRPEARGKGLGKRLLVELAKTAKARDCARMEWFVLDWNVPSIEFYKSLGAQPMEGWKIFRLTSDNISALAGL
ncbi:GNAT family N-acetyltransferase [Pelagibius sp. Alg239-R121]|uniref:GNAT family N-acetyltransferase n=1 Tax=Pelagibius sp. Alg239-R121 TaxID=2993448 RepID=UPI0024A73C0D|nr:GNAT family N-acetyltransferase [Pelagibius sp. Alg239-R121]